jgi:hypothetical protein
MDTETMGIFLDGEGGGKSKRTLRYLVRPARLLAILDEGKEQQPQQDDSPWRQFDSFLETLPVGLSLKTCPKSFMLTERGFGGICSPRFQAGGILYHGKCWTLSISEYRNAAVESSLLDILEVAPVQPRYFLTPKRCRALLRQAQRRGKGIPETLRSILEQTARELTNQSSTGTDTDSTAKYQEH